jgi:hypothetical protein
MIRRVRLDDDQYLLNRVVSGGALRIADGVRMQGRDV